MKIDYPKPLGISLVGWSVSVSNILLFVSYYYILLTQQTPAPAWFISFLSMAAVFPEDFFHRFLGEFWLVHFCWMFAVTICAFGILLLNQFARMIFIIFAIIHGVILAYIFIIHRTSPEFFTYFFKLYFNCAFIFAYVGFITIPEVRGQFKTLREGIKLKFWFEKGPLPRQVVQDAQGYFNLALAYSRLQRPNDAIATLQKAIRVNPHDARFHYELGMHYLKQKNSTEAIHAFKEAVRLDPSHFLAVFQLASLYQLEGCGREAVNFFEKARCLQPNNSQVYRQLGKAHLLTEDFLAAVADFQKALQLNPRDAETSYHLGRILLNKLGQEEKAREALRTAIHLEPDLVDAHHQLGVACLKLNRPKDAVRAFKDVIVREAEHRQAHYQLGFAYVILKDLDSARRECQALKRLDPELAERLSLLISSGNPQE